MRGYTFLAIVAFFSFAVFQQPGPLMQISEATPIVISEVVEEYEVKDESIVLHEEIEIIEGVEDEVAEELDEKLSEEEFVEESIDEEDDKESNEDEVVSEEIEDEGDVEIATDIPEELSENIGDDEEYVEEALGDAVLVLLEDGDDQPEEESPQEENPEINLVEQILEITK